MNKGNIVVIGLVAVAIIIALWFLVPKKNDVAMIDNQESDASNQLAPESPTGNPSGDKPTESQFKDTIDSSLNLVDDGMKQPTSSNLSPANNAEFTVEDVMKAVTFRWTPIVPKPQEPVTYRLKVWQLMQGQNSTQAMRTNKPIVTKDVADITEASVSGIYTGPCRPPYLCDYVWNVEASISQTGATPKVLATSASSSFSVKEPPATDGGTSGGTSGGTQ